MNLVGWSVNPLTGLGQSDLGYDLATQLWCPTVDISFPLSWHSLISCLGKSMTKISFILKGTTLREQISNKDGKRLLRCLIQWWIDSTKHCSKLGLPICIKMMIFTKLHLTFRREPLRSRYWYLSKLSVVTAFKSCLIFLLFIEQTKLTQSKTTSIRVWKKWIEK